MLLSDFGRALLMWLLVLCTVFALHSGDCVAAGSGGRVPTIPPRTAVTLVFVVCVIAVVLPIASQALGAAAQSAASSLALNAAELINPRAWAFQGWAIGVWAYWLLAAVLWYPHAAAAINDAGADAACDAVVQTPRYWAGLALGSAAVLILSLIHI